MRSMDVSGGVFQESFSKSLFYTAFSQEIPRFFFFADEHQDMCCRKRGGYVKISKMLCRYQGMCRYEDMSRTSKSVKTSGHVWHIYQGHAVDNRDDFLYDSLLVRP